MSNQALNPTPTAFQLPPTDIFSLGALAYELLFGYCPSISGTGSTGGRSGGGGTGSTGGSLTQQYQLLPVRSNLHEYRQRLAVVAAPQGGPLASVPASLQSVLRAMVTPAASSRPSAAAFSSAPYFQVGEGASREMACLFHCRSCVAMGLSLLWCRGHLMRIQGCGFGSGCW